MGIEVIKCVSGLDRKPGRVEKANKARRPSGAATLTGHQSLYESINLPDQILLRQHRLQFSRPTAVRADYFQSGTDLVH